MAAADPHSKALTYAPPDLRRRRRLRRLVVLVSVLLPLSVVGWRWGPTTYRHAGHLYWQRRCMEFVMPSGAVAYEEDPQRAAALLASPEGTHRPMRAGVIPEPHRYPPPPVAIRSRPASLDRLLPGHDHRDGLAFMHRRRSPGGNERLVFVPVGLGGSYPEGFRVYVGCPRVVVPASWRSFAPAAVVPLPADPWPEFGVEPQWGFSEDIDVDTRVFVPTFRLLAGQPDPVDLSHFTIEYETRCTHWEGPTVIRKTGEWERGALHYWLRDDDTFEIRDSGPLAKRYPGLTTLDVPPRR
jgi:hypothetical protein